MKNIRAIDKEECSLLEEVASDIAFAMHNFKVEEEHKQTGKKLTIMNRISKIFLTIPDDEMYQDVLKIILKAMESKSGVFGYPDRNGSLIVPTMTNAL